MHILNLKITAKANALILDAQRLRKEVKSDYCYDMKLFRFKYPLNLNCYFIKLGIECSKSEKYKINCIIY